MTDYSNISDSRLEMMAADAKSHIRSVWKSIVTLHEIRKEDVVVLTEIRAEQRRRSTK